MRLRMRKSTYLLEYSGKIYKNINLCTLCSLSMFLICMLWSGTACSCCNCQHESCVNYVAWYRNGHRWGIFCKQLRCLGVMPSIIFLLSQNIDVCVCVCESQKNSFIRLLYGYCYSVPVLIYKTTVYYNYHI